MTTDIHTLQLDVDGTIRDALGVPADFVSKIDAAIAVQDYLIARLDYLKSRSLVVDEWTPRLNEARRKRQALELLRTAAALVGSYSG